MKKIVILTIAMALFVSSCLPAPATDLPASSVDLNATAAVFVQQTLLALPSITSAPTNTPVIVVETPTAALSRSNTPNQTLTTGTVTPTGTLSTSTLASVTAAQTVITFTATASFTPLPNGVASPTETLHPRFYGTLPPEVPYNNIELVNKSKAEAYISLQVTTVDDLKTILEYPVGGLFSIQAPVGKYVYVVWVGGKKIVGVFTLNNSNGLRITIYKDRIEIKKS